MKKQHLSYDSAEDGLEALNKFKENPDNYFLILMDMVGCDPHQPHRILSNYTC